MRGATFSETLRRNWRGALYWAVGMFGYALYVTVIIQDVDMLQQYAELAKSFKPGILQLLGIGDDMTALATPEGFLGFAFFSWIVLFLAVYAILAGLNITANDEDNGILDVVLALPLPRWQIVLEKFAAYALLLAGIVAVTFLGLLVGGRFSALTLDMGRLFVTTLNVLPSLLLVMGFTAWVSVTVRRRSTAVAAASAFVAVSYLVNSLGGMASGTLADVLRGLSFFYYYDSSGVLQNGLAWGSIGLLFVVTIVLVGGTLWFFQRRDVGV
ncbi:MAG: ABC transporter permease subunit [Anaerolineae bacterium]|nr:ABC transporter permease subunit [Anaerolineae bacterium]